MTLSERVFLMNGMGVGGCVLFGFEVFESGQFDGYGFIGVKFFVFFFVEQELAFEVPEEVGVVLGDEGVVFPSLEARVLFEVLLKGGLGSVFGVGKHKSLSSLE